jgi:hypothetical protein
MKFICLGYIEDGKWDKMSKSQQEAMMQECFAYDDELRRGGHLTGGEALQSARAAATLRLQNGTVVATDGPYAETKEQLGGILILEARDMAEAIELMSKHPGIRWGSVFEIRPAYEEINALVEQRGKQLQTETKR